MKMGSESILHYQKNCNTDDCEKRYYKEFDFIYISENPMNFKKKEIPLQEVQNESNSIGYFRNGQLIRFDFNDQLTVEETYLVWEENLVCEAHTFLLRYRYNPSAQTKELLIPKLYQSYAYTYDDKSRLKEYYWKQNEKTNDSNRGEILVWQSYEYDDKGLKLIYKSLQGKDWSHGPFVLYDREKEHFMKQFTVSKRVIINCPARNNDGLVEFNNSDKYKTKTCPHCGDIQTYILTMNLNDRKSINKTSALDKMPVLFCFKCLNEQSYTLDELNLSVKTVPFLSDVSYKFVGTTDEEKLEEAFLSVGGEPRWVQNDEHPNCIACGKPMVFVMEIKSREDITNGKEHLMFGDCGSLYVFSCCKSIFVTMQCT